MSDRNLPNAMSGERRPIEAQGQASRRPRLWLWFVAGLLIVFVGMLFVVTMFTSDPSGEYLVRCKLWQYYVIELQRAQHPRGNLIGPLTPEHPAVGTIALQHLLISIAGGGVALAAGWVLRRIKSQ
jgi:hypothetical protein